MTELEDKLLATLDTFKTKIEEKPDYKAELEGWTRSVLIDAGDEKYNFVVDDAKVKDFQSGPMDDADITIISDVPTFLGLMNGEISMMKAYAKKQVQFKAPLADLLKLRKFISPSQ